MRKISFVLAAIMAIALNCNAQSSNGCYRGFIDAGYSIGVGDYEFGRFEVNTSHGYQFNPYFFLGAGAGLHFMSSYETKDMDIPLDVRDSQVDIPVFANIRCNSTCTVEIAHIHNIFVESSFYIKNKCNFNGKDKNRIYSQDYNSRWQGDIKTC